MHIFENTMKIMSVQAIPIQFPVILVHFTRKNCYLFRDSIILLYTKYIIIQYIYITNGVYYPIYSYFQ